MYGRENKGEGMESAVSEVEKVYRGAVVGGTGADGVGSANVLRRVINIYVYNKKNVIKIKML